MQLTCHDQDYTCGVNAWSMITNSTYHYIFLMVWLVLCLAATSANAQIADLSASTAGTIALNDSFAVKSAPSAWENTSTIDNNQKENTVITPGGPRSSENVYLVEPEEAVFTDSEGKTEIIRTSSLPSDWVITPGGPRPRSMVHEIEQGHALRMTNGSLQEIGPSGEVITDFGSFTPSGANVSIISRNISSASVAPPMGTGWITYASWTNNANVVADSFITAWTVPPAPTTSSGQLIYLFNGMQNNVPWILQPVLQWGYSPAGGGYDWEVASWYVSSGPAYHSQLAHVNPGDTVIGTITRTGTSQSGFSYNCVFQGIPETSLDVQNVAELYWFAETLEAYGITKCSDYPDTDYTQFGGIKIQNGNAWPILSWTPVNLVTDCGQYTQVVSNANPDGEVDIHYRGQSGQSWTNLNGYITSDPNAIIDNQQGRTEVWVRGKDNALWVNIDGTWYPAGGALSSNPFATRDYNGKIHVLVRGLDYHAWDYIFDPSSMTGHWKDLGGYLAEAPTSAMEPIYHNSLKVAVRGADNALWIGDLDINTEAFGGWTRLGGTLTSRPYIFFDSGSRAHVLVRGTDYALWDSEGIMGSDSQFYWSWNNLGGYIISQPYGTQEPGFSSYAMAFVRGGDGALWMGDINAAASPETCTWYYLGGSLTSDSPAVADLTVGKIHTFVRGIDDAVWENTVTTNPWTPTGSTWNKLGGNTISNTVAVIDSDTRAYTIGTDYALWRNKHGTFSAPMLACSDTQKNDTHP